MEGVKGDTMTTKEKIVNMLGDILGKEYFYDSLTDEVFYYREDNIQVVTTFEDFVNQAYEKWATTPTGL